MLDFNLTLGMYVPNLTIGMQGLRILTLEMSDQAIGMLQTLAVGMP